MLRPFRRPPADAALDESFDDAGKGRPTRSRKEAEAENRARAKAAQDPKATRRQARRTAAQPGASSKTVRAGMKAGDERFLPARDKGPVRRFVRDFVDSRLNIGELAIPLMFVSLIASATGAAGVGSMILNVTVLLVLFDGLILVARLRRELKRRFPDASHRGATFYALMRMLQLRFLRVPKTQVRMGDKLPDRY